MPAPKPPFDSTKQIHSYFHCKQCFEELPPDMSPKEWAKIAAGFTPHGIQIWCERHEKNILHVDFEGQTHPAILTSE